MGFCYRLSLLVLCVFFLEYKVGFAVVETTDDGVILERKSELLPELVSGRKDRVM